jgi:hypothetical protein
MAGGCQRSRLHGRCDPARGCELARRAFEPFDLERGFGEPARQILRAVQVRGDEIEGEAADEVRHWYEA